MSLELCFLLLCTIVNNITIGGSKKIIVLISTGLVVMRLAQVVRY